MRNINCIECGKDFLVYSYRIGKAKFCSYRCRNISYIGKAKLNKTGYYSNCLHCNDSFYQHNLDKRKFCSKRCADLGHNKENTSGKNHWNWKGGINNSNQYGRKLLDYRIWRKSVFARDDWTCGNCHLRGGKLEAHHIKPWALYPELRYLIDNGETLCQACHRQTDTWGFRMNNFQRKELN